MRLGCFRPLLALLLRLQRRRRRRLGLPGVECLKVNEEGLLHVRNVTRQPWMGGAILLIHFSMTKKQAALWHSSCVLLWGAPFLKKWTRAVQSSIKEQVRIFHYKMFFFAMQELLWLCIAVNHANWPLALFLLHYLKCGCTWFTIAINLIYTKAFTAVLKGM